MAIMGERTVLIVSRLLFAITFGMAVLHVMNTRNRVSDDGKGNPNLNVQEGV